MTAAREEAGLPAPTFEEKGAHFRVVLSAVRTGPIRLDESDQVILRLLEDGCGRSTAEIAKSISLSPRATRTRLSNLVSRGFIAGVGSGPQDSRRQHFRAGT